MTEATTKREKIFLNGYEIWLDKSHYSSRCVILCDSETSKHGVLVDIMGMYPYIHVSGLHLTKVEKEQLNNHLRKDEQLIKYL
jgi:hypothetical protein